MKTENKAPIYTLQKLYHEANALLEKYNVNEHNYELSVGFEMNKIECGITYDDKQFNRTKRGWVYSRDSNPVRCLQDFEEELARFSDETPIYERVAIEL